MPAIVLPKTLAQLQKVSDEEFVEMLLVTASIVLPVGGVATGFFTRMAQTPLGAKAVSLGGAKLGKFIARIVAEVVALAIAGNLFAQDALKASIFSMTGLWLETLDAEGVKRALGQKLADDVNEKYGTTFSSFYPPDKVVEETKNQVISELLSAVASAAPPPSSFKFLTSAVANDITTQIINRYRVIHNLPAVGVGVILPSDPQRVANKIRQATHRANNSRYSEWKNQYNDAIVTAYQTKLQALRVAKKAYDSAAARYNKALYREINGGSPSPSSAQLSVDKNAKHAIFIAAQSITYTGNGTTL